MALEQNIQNSPVFEASVNSGRLTLIRAASMVLKLAPESETIADKAALMSVVVSINGQDPALGKKLVGMIPF